MEETILLVGNEYKRPGYKVLEEAGESEDRGHDPRIEKPHHQARADFLEPNRHEKQRDTRKQKETDCQGNEEDKAFVPELDDLADYACDDRFNRHD